MFKISQKEIIRNTSYYQIFDKLPVFLDIMVGEKLYGFAKFLSAFLGGVTIEWATTRDNPGIKATLERYGIQCAYIK